MIGCNKPWNGNHVVEGAPLRCGTNLYHKTIKDKEATLEVVLCDDCKAKENTNV